MLFGKEKSVEEKVGQVVCELSEELVKLEKQSSSIFSMFHNMLSQLNTVDKQLQEKIEFTEGEISKMVAIKNGLVDTKSKNEKLYTKISEFVDV